MKKLFLSVVHAAILVAIPVYVQAAGAFTIGSLFEILHQQSVFQIEMQGTRIVLTDNESGQEVCSVVQENAETIALSAIVGHVDKSRQASIDLAAFNVSSAVGTLSFD